MSEKHKPNGRQIEQLAIQYKRHGIVPDEEMKKNMDDALWVSAELDRLIPKRAPEVKNAVAEFEAVSARISGIQNAA